MSRMDRTVGCVQYAAMNEAAMIRPGGATGLCRTERDERRVMCRTLVLWESLRKGDDLPTLADIRPGMSDDLAPFLYVIDVGLTMPSSRFGYCGPVLAQSCGAEPTGKTLAEVLPSSFAEPMIQFFRSAVHYRQALADSGSFHAAAGAEVLYRNVVMPLRGADDAIGHLLGGFSYRTIV